MLLRLLIVLTFVGPPGPQVCTCAVVKSAPLAAPTHEVATKSCRCGHHSEKSQAAHAVDAKCQAAHSDHPAPTGHEPSCPAAQPQPVPSAIAVSAVPTDTAAHDAVSPSFDTAPAFQPTLTSDCRGSGAPAPHVPLFITFHALRN